MHIKHKWTNWTIKIRTVHYAGGVGLGEYQRRECTKCGYIEEYPV